MAKVVTVDVMNREIVSMTTVSRLIAALQEINEKHGDIPVIYHDNGQIYMFNRESDLYFVSDGILYFGGIDKQGVKVGKIN